MMPHNIGAKFIFHFIMSRQVLMPDSFILDLAIESTVFQRGGGATFRGMGHGGTPRRPNTPTVGPRPKVWTRGQK